MTQQTTGSRQDKKSALLNRLKELEAKSLQEIDAIDTAEESSKKGSREIIQVNAISVRKYIEKIFSEGFRIGEDFERNREDYQKDNTYRWYANRINLHLGLVKDTPLILKTKGYREVVRQLAQ